MRKQCLYCGKKLPALKIKNSFGLAKYCTSACGVSYRYLRDTNPDHFGEILDKLRDSSGIIKNNNGKKKIHPRAMANSRMGVLD